MAESIPRRPRFRPEADPPQSREEVRQWFLRQCGVDLGDGPYWTEVPKEKGPGWFTPVIERAQAQSSGADVPWTLQWKHGNERRGFFKPRHPIPGVDIAFEAYFAVHRVKPRDAQRAIVRFVNAFAKHNRWNSKWPWPPPGPPPPRLTQWPPTPEAFGYNLPPAAVVWLMWWFGLRPVNDSAANTLSKLLRRHREK
jgi:hypothetical protein